MNSWENIFFWLIFVGGFEIKSRGDEHYEYAKTHLE